MIAVTVEIGRVQFSLRSLENERVRPLEQASATSPACRPTI